MNKQVEHFTLDIKNIYKQLGRIMAILNIQIILNTGHTYGTITDTVDIIKTENKGKHLNTLEKYQIYKISKNKLHMNVTHIDTYNQIFETLQEVSTR
jgi:hypothetical protein